MKNRLAGVLPLLWAIGLSACGGGGGSTSEPGVCAGSCMIADPCAGQGRSGGVALGNELLFAASSSSTCREIWKTDGTAAGTVLVKDINAGATASNPTNLTLLNGAAYFTATDSAHGTELWKTDGTAGGTLLVKDINPGTGSSLLPSYPGNFTQLNGELYFVANDGSNGYELWKTDGTDAGTILVKDINPGEGSSPYDSFPIDFAPFNDALYFSANDGINGRGLWKTDGTAAGTVLVKGFNTGFT